jgi:hypothetical protein
MTRIDRRRLLKVSGAGAIAASIGGMAAILAAGRAPAYGQTTSLQWLKFVDFVPVYRDRSNLSQVVSYAIPAAKLDITVFYPPFTVK